MRKLMLLLLLLLLAAVLSPAAAAEVDPRIAVLMDDLSRKKDHFTLGFDMLLIGVIERDRALGYPRAAWGMSPFLGFTWRDYDGQPSRLEIEKAAEVVTRDYGSLPERQWRRRVKAEVSDFTFSYFGMVTTFFLLPGIDVGVMWDFADHDGVGPSISLGVTWGLNTFFFPAPYFAASYSF